METPKNRTVTAFDTFYTTNHIRILKILLPYMDEPARRSLTVLIKFLELKYTMDYLHRTPSFPLHKGCGTRNANHRPTIEGCETDGGDDTPENGDSEEFFDGHADITELFAQIQNFCTPTERAMLEQLAGLKRSMEMYEKMAEMMQLFSQFESEDGEPLSGASDPTELIKGMLSPEQQMLFDLFGAKEPQ